MMFAQYCRIESSVGGVSCTQREFIRACLKLIKPTSRFSREFREMRHDWIRSGLEQRDNARNEYVAIMRGS